MADSSSLTGIDSSSPVVEAQSEDAQAVSQRRGEQASSLSSQPRKHRLERDEPPAWMSTLQREVQDEHASHATKDTIGQQERKLPETPVNERQQEQSAQTIVMDHDTGTADSRGAEQLNLSALPSTPRPDSSMPEKTLATDAVQEPLAGQRIAGGNAVEDLPTRPVELITSKRPVEDVPTTPLLAFPGERLQPSSRETIPADADPEQGSTSSAGTDIAHINTVLLQAHRQTPVPVAPSHYPGPGTAREAADASGRTKKRLPLIVGASAVLLLLLLAVGSWIIRLQPFQASSTTSVQQGFTDSKLGIALRYPNGWRTPQVDDGKKTVTLQDASDTAQMSLSIIDAATESPESYLQKQATQLGMSNAKMAAPSSFAGSSWSQIQGDMQVKGAEYTGALFATVYKNHLYTLTQLAPRSVYADEESLVFAPTRLSLHLS